MKQILTILAVLSALTSLCLFIALIWIFVAGGDFNIVLPGPGLVISGTFVLAVLLIFALITTALIALLARKISSPLR